jgi:hypothetical protein
MYSYINISSVLGVATYASTAQPNTNIGYANACQCNGVLSPSPLTRRPLVCPAGMYLQQVGYAALATSPTGSCAGCAGSGNCNASTVVTPFCVNNPGASGCCNMGTATAACANWGA